MEPKDAKVRINAKVGSYRTVLAREIKLRERARKAFSGIQELADSIEKFGLDNPLTVVKGEEEGKWELVAGERRFRALVLLGAAEIPVVVREDLDEVSRKGLELEENLQRENLSWEERIEGERQLDEIKRKSHEDWTLQDTAEAVQSSRSTVAREVAFATKLKARPELREAIKDLPLHAAIKRVARIEEAEKASRRDVEVKGLLVRGDARREMKKVKAGSVALVLTDPPYGIKEIEKNRDKGWSPQRATLQDADNLTEGKVKKLMKWFLKEVARVLMEGGHFYIFCCNQLWSTIREEALEAGLETQNYAIVWWKGRTTAPGRGYLWTPCYDLIMFGWKPPRKRMLEKNAPSLVMVKPVGRKSMIHPFQKPQELLRLFITQSTIPGEVVLDPFAGSGSTLVAAIGLGRVGQGIELDEGGKVFPLAAKRVEKALKKFRSKVENVNFQNGK